MIEANQLEPNYSIKSRLIKVGDGLKVIYGMITNKELLGRIVPLYEDKWTKLFKTDCENVIATLCVDYYKQFQNCPVRDGINDMEGIFESWYDKQKDVSHAENARNVLVNIIGQFQGQSISTQQYITMAENHFNVVKMENISEEVVTKLRNEKWEQARELYDDWEPVKLSSTKCVAGSDLVPEHLKWLRYGYLLRGYITLFEGEDKMGKGIAVAHWVACITRGKPLPGQPEENYPPSNVIWIPHEDEPKKAIIQRIAAAGGDVSKVFFLEEKDEELQFPRDLQKLRDIVKEHKARLVVFDPITECCSKDSMDFNNANHVRRFCKPLRDIAKEFQVCLLFIKHFRKGVGSASERGGGSGAWRHVARVQFFMGRDPEDPDNKDARVVSWSCGNYTESMPSKACTLLRCEVTMEGGRFKTVRCLWLDKVCDVTAEDIASTTGCAKKAGRPQDNKRQEAVTLIKKLLLSGEVKTCELDDKVRDSLNISDSMLYKAKVDAGVLTKKVRIDGKTVHFSHLLSETSSDG